MSFRLKVFLALLALVAGVVASTIWMAQAALGYSIERALNARYEERAAASRQQRATSEEEIRARAANLAKSVRVLAAITEHAEAADAETARQLLENVRDELVMPGAGQAGWSFQVFTAEGAMVPGDALPDFPQMRAKDWPPAPEVIRQSMEKREALAGLLASTNDAVWEAAFQTIVDPVENQAHGALLVARPRASTIGGADAVGLRLRGHWIGGFPAPVDLGDQSELIIDGVPHLVFVQSLVKAGLFPSADEAVAFSLAEKARQRRALTGRLLAIGGLALLLAAGVAVGLAHGLSTPIRDLVAATRSVRAGDFTARAPVRRRDELGRLASAFNDMTADLALKEKYRGILNVVSDPQVARALLESGVELGGEERDVSVIFCDIRGFTPMTEGMAPSEVIAMLNEHFTPLTRVVYEHGGVVLQFAGDLIMALFGAPAVCENHARQAAQCALAMIAERDRQNRQGPRVVEMGIGVATGRVVAGRMGSADRLNYSVVGARVNLAARLCSQARAMRVIIDAATLAGCGEGADVKPLGALRLKGFSEEVEAYELSGFDSAA